MSSESYRQWLVENGGQEVGSLFAFIVECLDEPYKSHQCIGQIIKATDECNWVYVEVFMEEWSSQCFLLCLPAFLCAAEKSIAPDYDIYTSMTIYLSGSMSYIDSANPRRADECTWTILKTVIRWIVKHRCTRYTPSDSFLLEELTQRFMKRPMLQPPGRCTWEFLEALMEDPRNPVASRYLIELIHFWHVQVPRGYVRCDPDRLISNQIEQQREAITKHWHKVKHMYKVTDWHNDLIRHHMECLLDE